MNKFTNDWLAQQTMQGTDALEVAMGFYSLGLQGLSDACGLNFRTARRLVSHLQENLSIGDAEQLQSALLKAAEYGVADVQTYLHDQAELVLGLQQKAWAIYEEHFTQMKTSAEKMVTETRKVSPGASEVVGSALRSWVGGAQSAVQQMNMISTQMNELAGKNTALLSAWRVSPVGTKRSNGKATVSA